MAPREAVADVTADAGQVTGAAALAVSDRAFALQVAAHAPPPPELVSIRVESTPSGAQVFDADGQLIGETPLDFQRQKDSGAFELTVKRPSFGPKTVTVGTAENVVQHVRLARIRKNNGATGHGTSDDGKKPGGSFGTF
ncbi:MAG: PEGA domain-containing protein [Deltaproteobacteria bacterium]|nr:MAG: PEGA domain-containing protein [Deltaproteobacteria bacterium]